MPRVPTNTAEQFFRLLVIQRQQELSSRSGGAVRRAEGSDVFRHLFCQERLRAAEVHHQRAPIGELIAARCVFHAALLKPYPYSLRVSGEMAGPQEPLAAVVNLIWCRQGGEQFCRKPAMIREFWQFFEMLLV